MAKRLYAANSNELANTYELGNNSKP